jgi:hypothetical protein
MKQRSVWGAAALTVTAAVAMGGCALEQLDAPEVEATEMQALAGGPCGDELCGQNSPVIDVFQFHDANTRGLPNNIGLTIDTVSGRAQIVKGTVSYDLVVHDAHLSGVRGTTVISGTQLIGATIPVSQGKSHWQIAITDARELPYYVGAPGKVGTYKIEVHSGEGAVMELCSNRRLLEKMIADQGGLESDYARLELMGMRTWETVFFEGDRVDSPSKTTSKDAAIDDTWFNIGCAGHMLAKLLLTRNTYHSQAPGIPRAWEQRQATLKMYAADYCGNGIPFTVAGQKLVWQGDAMSYGIPPKEIEARWNQNGAICLNVPRLVHASSPLGVSTYPDVRRSIRTLCVNPDPPPPPCLNTNPYDFAGADRVSGNPPW